MQKIRILIVDDHLVVREGLNAILATQSDMNVVGRAADGEEAVALASALHPDVILMDLVMPRMDGIAAIRQIKRENPDACILALTSFTHDDKVFAAVNNGALGYLLKDATHDQLIHAIRDVAAGRVVLHPAIAVKVMHALDQPSDLPPTPEPLTDRELDVLRLIAQGLTNKEIGDALSIQERTVARHVSSILAKLHLANRLKAALYALKKGIATL